MKQGSRGALALRSKTDKRRNRSKLLWRFQQKPILLFHRIVAFTGGISEPLDVHDADIAAGVLDDACPLQRVSHRCYAGAPHAKHFTKEFLGEWQMVTARQIAGA